MSYQRKRSVRTDATFLAKIARPAPAAVYARTRVFKLLDRARKCPVVWISAPAGAGKTTLIASYLQARKLPVIWYQMDFGDNDAASFFYYMGLAVKEAAPRYRRPMPLLTGEYAASLPTFAANYFRELFSRIKRHTVVVLDNYQELAADGAMQQLLQQGFAEIPRHVNVIVLSREGPPAAFARTRVSGRLALLDWNDVRFTESESAAVAKLHNRGVPLPADTMRRLYQQTEGWVAGVVLLSEQAAQGIAQLQRTEASASQNVFDYFANEIFRHAESFVQAFLLNTAFLPKVSVSIAERLTGEPATEGILSYLARRNLFTVRSADGSYEYHPLFRSFLMSRAVASYGADGVATMRRRIATLLADAGDVEGAVTLLLQPPAQSREALALVLEQAGSLAATGRTATLEAWLKALPEPSSAENPWVAYWLGVCRLAFAPAEARRYFEHAFALFRKQHDASPLYLAWSGIIESYVLERNDFAPMREWLDIYRTLAADRAPPSPDIESASVFTYVLGLVNGSFEHPDLPVYAERATRLLERERDPARWFTKVIALLPYYIWKGDLNTTSQLLTRLSAYARSLSAKPLAQLYWYTWKCLYDGPTGEPEASLQAVVNGLALAENSGVHVFDSQLLGYGIWGQLCVGNVAKARELLDRLPPLIGERRVGNAFYNHFTSLVLLHEGDIARAVEHSRRAAHQARDSGLSVGSVSYLIGFAFALATQGELDEAMRVVMEARRKAAAINSRLFDYYGALCEANVHRLLGDHEQTVRLLREAFAVARELMVISPAYCPRDAAAELHAIALDADIQPGFMRATIPKARLPAPSHVYSERWPWPVRIYALGRFTVVKDGEPLDLGVRARKKPLELLRALIAFGGTGVGVSKLTQALWPEADGDLARRTMETTLHRLRRLVGEECVLRQENQLSLNPRYCWLDVRALEQLTETGKHPLPTALRAQRLMKIYRGPFLGDEEDGPALLMRERLQARFIRSISDLGEKLETEGNDKAAAECYEKAIDIEPLGEDLYRRLMRCYQRLDRCSQALAVYRRCRTALAAVAHNQPSQETQALYEEIRKAS